MEQTYPFTAIVGQEQMKLALILNLINPALGGVLIRKEKAANTKDIIHSTVGRVASLTRRWKMAHGSGKM